MTRLILTGMVLASLSVGAAAGARLSPNIPTRRTPRHPAPTRHRTPRTTCTSPQTPGGICGSPPPS